MCNLLSNLQEGVDKQYRLVETLLAKRQVAFQGRTVEASEEMGIYFLSDRHTNEILYVGRTTKGVISRLKDHWDGPTSSDLSNMLVSQWVVDSIAEGRRWIKDNVYVRWLNRNELDTCIRWAEHIAIAVLRPKLNK